MRRRRRRGFTLIEVMISAALLGFGVLAGVRLFGSSTKGTAYVRDRAIATTLVVEQMERMGTQGMERLPSCPGLAGCRASTTLLAPPVACSALIENKFRVDTVINEHPDKDRQRNARIATVSSCWTDVHGVVHEAQLERLFVPEI
jgi:prepilin-type N-terminal cleavage/methylation domain-containing protein